ncbi:PREDICTED: FYVE, RhoGEF and PH domain-containing protein 6-like, partial [Rhagoletis zephyria]|uniref:FYVE, RhoGEF and PH domain-containing protein 6-like n=1 Tax=Rhagoletis zephyria TaxID=28612 RepID=UPI0008115865
MWLTERDYVDVLQMLTKEFREAVQGTVNGYFLNKFFRPLDQVLPINERLLKELEQRVLVDWDDNPKISDIMIKICPFFKEYSIFVREFDQLNHMLDEASELFPDFNAALTAFQRTDRCKKLSIKNYLLKPIQRLPQYPLLITTYLKKLKSDDPDYENTQRALKVVTEVVEHVNRESHQAEKALKLAELKNRIISKTPDAIVKPGRELIKEGPLLKISRKEVQERYFILFNDALLYLVPVMNEMIRLNEEFPLDGMEVDISNQSDREFVIRSMRRSFALMARSKDERAAW